MQSGTRDAIQQPFQELARRWGVRDASHTDDGHSTETATFDLTAATLDNEDPIGHLLGHYEDEYSNEATTSRENQQEKDSEKLHQTSTGENFRKSSLQHLIDPESYLDELDRHGLADYTILSSCGGSETDSYEDYDLGASPRKKRKHVSDSGDRCKTSLRRFLKANVQPRPTVTKIKNKSRYDFIVEQVRSISCSFLVSFDSTMLKGKLSYDWLLSICSCILNCDKDLLSDEVRKLEIKLFAEIYDFDHLRRRINVIKIKKSKNSRYAHRLKVF